MLAREHQLSLHLSLFAARYYNSVSIRAQLMTNDGNFEEVAEFKYLGTIIKNRNEMHKEIKHRLNSGNACYYALQRLHIICSLFSEYIVLES